MTVYSIWLQSAIGFACKNSNEILKHFGNAKVIFDSSESELKKCGLFTASQIKRLCKKDLSDAERILDCCTDNNIKTVCLKDEGYPYCLSVLTDAPVVLYYRGNLPDFDGTPSICVVGPRNLSDFGKKAAFSLGYRIAASGAVVVSGGAKGADTNAHAGALRAGGITVVCLGCGILYNYLPENKAMRDAAEQRGCIISEYPPLHRADKITFPQRNRIMSGLCLGTVVIEAPLKSGSLITASLALEQGRDVFVIPGTPSNPIYEGSNKLLRDGAKPIIDITDILGEYIVRYPDKINIENAYKESSILTDSPRKAAAKEKDFKKTSKNLPETLSKEAKIVYNQLDKQKFYPEDVNIPDMDTGELLSALTELQMEFLIRALPGGMYEKL